MPKRYGYFSYLARVDGSSIYRTPEGREVEVTCVGFHENPKDGEYFWDDAVAVGEVTEWIREGTPHYESRQKKYRKLYP